MRTKRSALRAGLAALLAASVLLLPLARAGDDPMFFRAFTPCLGNSASCAPEVLAIGGIEPDTARKLSTYLASPAAANAGLTSTPTIVFYSPGGSIKGAIDLGRLIRKRGLPTAVRNKIEEQFFANNAQGYGRRTLASSTMCASACTLAFIGGVSRSVDKGARFGVHQFRKAGGDAGDSVTQTVMTDLAIYVEDMGVDRRMVDLASTAAPDDMLWLPDSVIRDLRIDNTQAPLAAWTIKSNKDGQPSLLVRQQVAYNRSVVIQFSAATGPGLKGIEVLVAAIFAKEGNSDRQKEYPVGELPEVTFTVDNTTITPAPAEQWTDQGKLKDGSSAFSATFRISRAELDKISRAHSVAISDNFPMATIDLSISTPLSTENLASGAALVLRSN